jgi:hypothetical protein
MPFSAQSPQGDQTAQTSKSAVLNKLRMSFAQGGGFTSPIATPQPVAATPTPVAPVTSVPPAPIVEPENVSVAEPVPQAAPKLEQVLQEASQSAPEPLPPEEISSLAAAVPTAVAQVAEDSLNPSYPVGGTVKEVGPLPTAVETPQVDVSPGLQYVETEPQEMPPEVESFLTKVENHHEQLPQEIVIKENSAADPVLQSIPQPVIVLPITPEIEKKGLSKNAEFSVRWLVEWSHKMIKMFAGRVIYKPAT